MRAAVYYDSSVSGRNDGNPFYVFNVLKNQMGIETLHLAPRGDLSSYGKFDFHVWCDWGEDALEYPEFVCPKPNIYWASDTHLGYDYRLKKAREFDVVFVAQLDAVEKFKKDGIKNVMWLPHAFEPQAYGPEPAQINRYDVGFVGYCNGENRADFLDRMFKAFPRFFWGQRLFEEAANIYKSSYVVPNISINNDINMRCFEVMGSGSFLLTDDLSHNGMKELFLPGIHCETWKTVDEAVEKAGYYIAKEYKRDKIAEAGLRNAHARHTMKHRVEVMLKEIEKVTGKVSVAV